MSLDIYLELPRCEHCGVGGDGAGGTSSVYDWNYTYNCGPMWCAAGIDLSSKDWDGKLAGDMVAPLRAAVAAMQSDMPKFEAMDPPNKWGSAATLVVRLGELADACERTPTASIRMWR